MTSQEIIDGLQFTVDMFLFDPLTVETLTELRNDMDKTTIDACKEAIKLLKKMQTEQVKVGDEVQSVYGTNVGEKYMVTKLMNEHYANVMTHDGGVAYINPANYQKTGRHFPQIAEVLKQMGGGKE